VKGEILFHGCSMKSLAQAFPPCPLALKIPKLANSISQFLKTTLSRLIDWKTILVIEYPLISHWMGLSLIDMG
jgi:hypothetical protein